MTAQRKLSWQDVRLLIVGGVGLAMAGCGGGGGSSGSSSSSTPVPSPSIVPAPSVVPAPGRAAVIYIPNGSSMSVGDRSPSTGSSMTLAETSPSAPTTASVNVTGPLQGGRTVGATPTMQYDATGSISPFLTSYETTGTGDYASLLKLRDAGNGQLLSHSSYGFLVTSPQSAPNSAYLGAYHSGTLTPTSELPTGVTATYTGSFYGTGIGDGQSMSTGIFIVNGDAQLNADFGAGTVQGNVGNIRSSTNGNVSSAPYGLSMNGTITGNAYSGTVGYTTGSTPAGTVTDSAMTGRFYGPNAAETAGALRIEGTAPGTSGSSAIVGAFGARKQ